MAPNGAGRIFPTNPDLADILVRTDFDFENCYFKDIFGSLFLDFQVPRFPDQAWVGLGLCLGRAWAGPGLGSAKKIGLAVRCGPDLTYTWKT